jgi:hypothetical protein
MPSGRRATALIRFWTPSMLLPAIVSTVVLTGTVVAVRQPKTELAPELKAAQKAEDRTPVSATYHLCFIAKHSKQSLALCRSQMVCDAAVIPPKSLWP